MIIKGEHLVLGRDETYNPDVQEAESIRYGSAAFMVVPLASGRIAVLGHMRDLHSICDTWAEACESARDIQMLQWRSRTERPSGLPKGNTKQEVDELSSLLDL